MQRARAGGGTGAARARARAGHAGRTAEAHSARTKLWAGVHRLGESLLGEPPLSVALAAQEAEEREGAEARAGGASGEAARGGAGSSRRPAYASLSPKRATAEQRKARQVAHRSSVGGPPPASDLPERKKEAEVRRRLAVGLPPPASELPENRKDAEFRRRLQVGAPPAYTPPPTPQHAAATGDHADGVLREHARTSPRPQWQTLKGNKAKGPGPGAPGGAEDRECAACGEDTRCYEDTSEAGPSGSLGLKSDAGASWYCAACWEDYCPSSRYFAEHFFQIERAALAQLRPGSSFPAECSAVRYPDRAYSQAIPYAQPVAGATLGSPLAVDSTAQAIPIMVDGKAVDGYDTNGDGVIDSIDVDGDGVIDQTGNFGLAAGPAQGSGTTTVVL